MLETRKRGDTRPLQMQLLEGGRVVPLTGSVVVVINVVPKVTGVGVPLRNRVVAVSDAAAGKVTWNPVASEVAVAGLYAFEWEVTFGDGTIATFPDDGDCTLELLPDHTWR